MAISDMIPPAETDAFLDAAGWHGATVAPLAGDASFRRYFRVTRGEDVAVLMDAPAPHEDTRPFLAMADYLSGIGLSAPAILHRDIDQGLLLIEDFGDVQMRPYVDARPELEMDYYRGVVDVLVALHAHQPPPSLTRHGVAQWIEEVGLFIDWYGPAVGLSLDPVSFQEAWRTVLAPVEQDGEIWVTELRDYHAENVMLLPGKTGVQRFGLLDFQDAMVGHPAYDLVSMLEDARRDVSPAVERAMLSHYMTATSRTAQFEEAYWALGAQRNTRILGVFCRLWKRDGKIHYTRFQQRMWGLLERDLAHPALAPLRAWFDAHVPLEKRAAFWAEYAA